MIRAYLMLTIFSLAFASGAFARGGESRQILGSIEDSTGAVVPGFTATATHVATG